MILKYEIFDKDERYIFLMHGFLYFFECFYPMGKLRRK